MKIFISADMEGISGVATNQQLKTPSEYQRFRQVDDCRCKCSH